MSFLKKIQKIFIEEKDEEIEKVIEEGEVDTLYTPSRTLEENFKKPKDIEEEKNKKTSFVDIVVDDEIAQKKRVEKRKRSIVEEQIVEKEKNEYAYNPVISPIYGVKEDQLLVNKKHESLAYQEEYVVDRADTVISPMYGKRSVSGYSKKDQIPSFEEKFNSKKEDFYYDENDGLQLDDMISDEDTDALDDTVQISLFGDNVSVHASEDFQLEEELEEEFPDLKEEDFIVDDIASNEE